MVTLAREPSCPYLHCDENHPRRLPRCPACQGRLLWCNGCGTANRAEASFCRQCGAPLQAHDEWRLPGGNLQRTGHLPIRARLPGSALPRHVRAFNTRVEAGLIAGYDRLILAALRSVEILSASSLQTQASLPSPGGGEIYHTPALAGGVLYVVSQEGAAAWNLRPMLQGQDPLLLWELPARLGPFIGSPLPVGDWVYLPAYEGLLAVNARGESVRLLEGPTRTLVQFADLIVAAPDETSLVALDGEGSVRWRQELLGLSRQPIAIATDCGLVADGDSLRFTDEQGWLYQCYQGTGPRKVAKGPTNPTGLSVGPDGSIYISSLSGLEALARSGHRRWLYELEGVSTAAIVLEGLVLAGTSQGHLLLLESESGVALTGRVGTGAVRGLAVQGPMVAAVTSDGDLATFDLPLEEEKA